MLQALCFMAGANSMFYGDALLTTANPQCRPTSAAGAAGHAHRRRACARGAGVPLTPGLLYLAASIACSVTVAAMLKLARGWRIDVRQAIVNYAVAATLCWALLRPASDTLFAAGTPWLTLAALGILLPACSSPWRRPCAMPAWRSDAAQRLALFIPLIAAFLLFGETPDASWPRSRWRSARCAAPPVAGRRARRGRRDSWLWPLIVWAGYGVIDVLFKQVARTGTAFSGALLLAFMLAGMLMLGLVWRRARWGGAMRWRAWRWVWRTFGNILTYIRAHQSLPGHPSVVFASMNMGHRPGALIGALAFRESLSRLNLLGLALALAIVLMIPAALRAASGAGAQARFGRFFVQVFRVRHHSRLIAHVRGLGGGGMICRRL